MHEDPRSIPTIRVLGCMIHEEAPARSNSKFPGPSLEKRARSALVPPLRLTIKHTHHRTDFVVARDVWSPPNDLVRNLRALGSGTVRHRSLVRQDQAMMMPANYVCGLVPVFSCRRTRDAGRVTAKLSHWFCVCTAQSVPSGPGRSRIYGMHGRPHCDAVRP